MVPIAMGELLYFHLSYKHEIIISYLFKDCEIGRKSSQPTKGDICHDCIKPDSMASQQTVEQEALPKYVAAGDLMFFALWSY